MGTLISPTVVLTFGHCAKDNLLTWVSFEQEIDFSNRANYPSLIDFLNAEWLTGTAIAHPEFGNFYSTWPNTYDLGVVILDDSVYMSQYGQIAPLGFFDSFSKGHQANNFTAVGYGMQGFIPSFYSDVWARYYGTVKLVEYKGALNGNQHSVKFSNNPGTGGGTCYGDSGGPTLGFSVRFPALSFKCSSANPVPENGPSGAGLEDTRSQAACTNTAGARRQCAPAVVIHSSCLIRPFLLSTIKYPPPAGCGANVQNLATSES